MKSKKQAIAFGGMILFSGCCLLSTSAAAYGPQWRPGPGYPATHGAGFGQIANSPGFRPQTAPPPRFYQTRHRRVAPQRFYPSSVARSPAGYPMYRMPQYSGPGFPAFGPGPSSWMPAPAMTAQPWRQPPPGFAQRLDNRQPPAPQYRVGPAAAPRRHWQRMPTAPRRLGFRPADPRGLPAHGSWRPVAQANVAAAGAANSPAPGYTPRLWGDPGHGGDGFRARPRGQAVGRGPTSLRATYRNWRPVTGGQALPSRSATAFRPMGYGRAEVNTGRVASSTYPMSAAGRAKLPGWATTYQDTKDGGLCSWCGGS